MHLRWVVIGAMIVVSGSASAGMCPVATPLAAVLTPSNATISTDSGGVVVGVVPGGDGVTADKLAKLPWELRAKGAAVSSTVTVLAPGLAVIRPKVDGDLELVDGKHTRLRLRASKAPATAAAAPVVTSVRYVGDFRPNLTSEVTTAVFANQPPVGTVAVLVYPTSDVTGPARSWSVVTPGARSIELFAQRKCMPVPDGTPLHKGDQIRLVWLDGAGQRSSPSAPIVVK